MASSTKPKFYMKSEINDLRKEDLHNALSERGLDTIGKVEILKQRLKDVTHVNLKM